MSMTGHWRRLWLVVGGVACFDLAAKLWLLSTFLCATCTAPDVAQTSAPPPAPTTERISAAGVYYRRCERVILAVVLSPEPCDWGRAPDQTVASRKSGIARDRRRPHQDSPTTITVRSSAKRPGVLPLTPG
jgi:hypothetical protein